MKWASGEVVGILTFLLPGFVAAAIFYSLTSYPKPNIFERIIQALIFTSIGQAITILILVLYRTIEENILYVKNYEPIISLLISILLGFVAAYISNRDTVHGFLRRIGVTKETSYPSEWYSTFSRHSGSYIVLHLEGERRLYGWPEEWPNSPDDGHFRIAEGEWLVEDKRIPATGVSAVLIPAGKVEMVEFMKRAS